MKKLREYYLQARTYLEKDIWRIHLSQLPYYRSLYIRLLRIVMIVLRGVSKGKLTLRSSSLTFYSVLAIVPFLAIIFGIAKGFGAELYIRDFIMNSLAIQEKFMTRIIDFANALLEKTRGDLIAGIAFILLIWTIITVLNTVERTFNNIWQIYKKRSFIRKFTDYLALILVAPALIIVSSSITVYISTQLDTLAEKIKVLEYITPMVILLVKFIPYLLIWVLLTFVYMIFPNTKVKFKSALLAGIVAGTVYQIVQWYYIRFQVGITNYNAIYGSFAAIPLFLIWINLSWQIILFGAEISFADQNVDTYDFEDNSMRLSHAHKRLLAIMIMHRIIRQFEEGTHPLTSSDIAISLGIPTRLTNQLINQLIACELVSETYDQQRTESGFQPARAISTITIQNMMETFDFLGMEDINVSDVALLEAVEEKIAAFRTAIEKSPSNILVKDLLEYPTYEHTKLKEN